MKVKTVSIRIELSVHEAQGLVKEIEYTESVLSQTRPGSEAVTSDVTVLVEVP